jgi:hypothetical protein
MIDLMSDRFISGLIFAIQLFRQINLAIFI